MLCSVTLLPFPSPPLEAELLGLLGLDAVIVESGEQCAVTGVPRLVHMPTDKKRAANNKALD